MVRPRKPKSNADVKPPAGQRSFLESPLFATRLALDDARPATGPSPAPPAAPVKPPASAPAANEGHRERLRTRFLKTGPEGLPDYELLELLLFNAIVRRDTKALAKRQRREARVCSHPSARSLTQTCGGRLAVTCRSGGPSVGPLAKGCIDALDRFSAPPAP